jgi:hypothetical protein
MAGALPSWSPYNYGVNDPVFYNDPLGDYIQPSLRKEVPGPMANHSGSGGFSNYTAALFGGEVTRGYSAYPTGGSSGVSELSIGATTITIDWSQVEGDGVSFDYTNGMLEDVNLLNVEDGGYWINDNYIDENGRAVIHSTFIAGERDTRGAGYISFNQTYEYSRTGFVPLNENVGYQIANYQIRYPYIEILSLLVISTRLQLVLFQE